MKSLLKNACFTIAAATGLLIVGAIVLNSVMDYLLP